MKTSKKKTRRENHQQHKESEKTSYYYNGSVYNPQTETGITGAYGSQGEKDSDNSYTRAIKY